jgi:hypothetical protein
MTTGACQAGSRRRGAAVVLWSAGPEVIVRTGRERLTLAVADEPAAPVGETVTCPANAATVSRAMIGARSSG